MNGLTFVRKGDCEKEETFIDRYRQFGTSVTDAPEQYHTATGAVILSCIMAPYANLETSYGAIRPNLWTMILAGTTVTRKSTTMDLAVKILEDVHPDFYMASDGSPEGLLGEMSMRDGKTSLFHVDEVTGFMEAATRKDYNAGMLESLTRLYDGKRVKRTLRREVIDIQKPNLVIMCGGIKKRMAEVVTVDHIGSGFLPRFLVVTGTTTSDQLRPIGPREVDNGPDLREGILKELYDLIHFWMPSGSEEKTVGGITKKVKRTPTERKMIATPEAWQRIRDLQHDATVLGENASDPNIYMPMYTRLANSVIKVAILLAGARQSTEITFNDVCQAIRLSDVWLSSAEEFAAAVEEQPDMDKNEKKLQKVVNFIRDAGEPVSRALVMRKFHCKQFEMTQMEETMVARGYIETKRERVKKDGGLSSKPTTFYVILHPEEFRDDTLRSSRRDDRSEEASFSEV